MRRLSLLILLLVHGVVTAQSDVHKPISTGDCTPHKGGDYNDSSAVVWIPLAQKWIMNDQRAFFVFSKDGVLEHQSAGTVTCKGVGQHEGFALVDSPRCSNDSSRRCYTSADCVAPGACTGAGPYGDVLWAQEENLGYRCTNSPTTTCSDDAQCGGIAGQSNLCKGTGAMCRYSIAAVLNMGQGGNPSTPVSLEEVWVTDVPYDSSEGLVFVPDATSTGRYGGTFFWSEQANARWRKLSLDPAQPAIAWGAYTSFPSGCVVGELSDGYYDFVKARFYSQSDGGNRITVHSADFSTCYATVSDPATCRADNGFEGAAFGGGRFAYSDDYTGHTDDAYNGLWLLEDDFCGDDVKVSTEICDGIDLAGKSCETADPALCAGGHCGPGFHGSLSCRPDCAKFEDSACAKIDDVENLHRSDTH